MKPQEEDRLVSEVRKQAEQSQRGQRLNLWAGFGLVGWIGWMVVMPALVGVALGRYLDVRFTTHIFWTLSLLMLGLAIGCLAAWRHIAEVLEE